jgi:hypothetical protein
MRKRPWLFALVMLSICLVVLLPRPGLVKADANVTIDYNANDEQAVTALQNWCEVPHA